MYTDIQKQIICELQNIKIAEEELLNRLQSYNDMTNHYMNEKSCICGKTFKYHITEYGDEYLYCDDCKIVIKLISVNEIELLL